MKKRLAYYFLSAVATGIVAIILLGALLSCCSPEKGIQVEAKLLTIKDVSEVGRYNGPRAKITWVDEHGIEYIQYTQWPTSYYKGYQNTMLLRK